MELVIIAALAFWLGWRSNSVIMTMTFRQILRDLGVPEDQLRRLARQKGLDIEAPEEAPESQPTAEHEIVIEQHGSELYAYKTNGEFLAQAPDQEALISRIAARYKNVRFTVKEGRELLQKSHS